MCFRASEQKSKAGKLKLIPGKVTDDISKWYVSRVTDVFDNTKFNDDKK